MATVASIGHQVCVICQDTLLNTQGKLAKNGTCAHIFHESCLVKWLKTSPTCPSCRKPIIDRKIFPVCVICGEPSCTEKNRIILLDPCRHHAHIDCLNATEWICPLDQRNVWLHV